MIKKHPAAKCLAMLLALALVALPVLSALDSLRPREAKVKSCIRRGCSAAEVSSILRRVAAEDRIGIWNSLEVGKFVDGLDPGERALFLNSTALPWDREFWKATAEWDGSRRRRVFLRGVEACQFFGALDAENATAIISANLERAEKEGYGFLTNANDVGTSLRFRTMIEQMQLLSQSAK